MKPEEIPPLVTGFLDKFFEQELVAAQQELDFLYENQFEAPQIDYLKMRRFLVTATNQLKNLDQNLVSGLVAKLYQDIQRIYEYYADFIKKTKMAKLIYVRDFLPTVPEYAQLQNEVTLTEGQKKRFSAIAGQTDRELAALPTPKNDEELAYLKQVRRRNVDATHNFVKAKEKLVVIAQQLKELETAMSAEFLSQYEEYVTNLKEGLEEILNTKSYYYDKLLWEKAAQSASVRKFFHQARIEGDFSTRTFIQYYMRNIDINKSGTSDWHNYLREVLKVLE